MPQTHAQIWGTLKRYLAYTAAGFVILGGVGAMEAGRPPLVVPASASQTLRASVSQQALLLTAVGTPSWTQRLRFDLAATVSVAAKELEPRPFVTASQTPYYPAPDTTQQDASESFTAEPAAPAPTPTVEPAKATAAAAPAPTPKDATTEAPAVANAPVATVTAPAPQVAPAPAIVAANAPAPAPQAPPQPPVQKLADASSPSLLATLNWIYGDTKTAPADDDDANATGTPPAATPAPASPDALSDVPPAVDTPDSDAPASDANNPAPADSDAPAADTAAPDNSAPNDAAAATPDNTATPDNSATGDTTAASASPSNSEAAPANPGPADPAAAQIASAASSASNDKFDAPVGQQKVIQVRRGDTLFGLLMRAGLSQSEAQAAGHSLADVFAPSDLKVGQQITLNLATAAGPDNDDADDNSGKLLGLTLTPSVERDVKLTRSSDGQFVSASVDRPLTERVDRAAGDIDGSLFESAHDAGLPVGLIGDLIKALSYDVDFQRDIHQGDSFEVMYERYDNENGDLAKPGRLLYASLTLGGKPMTIYYFERDGDGEYYTGDGAAVRKSLLKTPIDGAKITSGYGMRVNPILGYSMMHQGIDFGAPIGTPIYAAGNGVVEEIGEKNGYGNYIRLRHNGTYETAYAHISKFASGLKRGSKVKQGQVIAYVGETGRATGPHLHFEVLINGQHVNPSTVKTVAADKLTGADLKAFRAQLASLESQRRQLAGHAEIADQSGNTQLDCTRRSGCDN